MQIGGVVASREFRGVLGTPIADAYVEPFGPTKGRLTVEPTKRQSISVSLPSVEVVFEGASLSFMYPSVAEAEAALASLVVHKGY